MEASHTELDLTSDVGAVGRASVRPDAPNKLTLDIKGLPSLWPGGRRPCAEG